MTTPVHVYADYVCPYCLLAEQVLSEALADQDVEIQWHPFELRPDPMPTLRVEDPYLPEVWKRSVYPLARRLGVDIRLPTISPQPRTALAFQAFAFAEEHRQGHAFSMRAMEAFFQENRDIGRIDVLVDLGGEIGLDPGALRHALEDGRYVRRHAAALHHATQERAIHAVPTIFIGDRRFSGMPSAPAIRDAVHDLRAIGNGNVDAGGEGAGAA